MILNSTLAQSMEATLKSEITNPKPKTVKNGGKRTTKGHLQSPLELKQEGIRYLA